MLFCMTRGLVEQSLNLQKPLLIQDKPYVPEYVQLSLDACHD